MPRFVTPVLLCLLALAGCRQMADVQTPSAVATVAHLNEAGTITAAHTFPISGPSWGSQRIVWLVPEGTMVAPGDTLVRLDTTEILSYLQRNRYDLESKHMAVLRARAEAAANHTRTANAIDKSRLADETARLDLENKRFESATVQATTKLAARQAAIDLGQAERNYRAQATLDSLNIAQAELKEAKQAAKVQRSQTYVDQLTITAFGEGMVVYHRQHTEEGVKVARVGEEIQRGQAIVEITDTSAMKVVFSVHEKDRWRLHEGQQVQVILDAYADTTFTGRIVGVGNLPQAAEEGSVAQRFEVTAAIDDQDPCLKPGMSARVIIALGGLP